MASRPDEDAVPTDSIVLGAFEGIKNTVAPERLLPSELERALNVDIDDTGMVRLRRGQTRISTGDFHSLYNHGSTLYAVKNGILGVVRPDATFTTVQDVQDSRLAYTHVDDTLYYTSESASGKVTSGVHAPWGQRGGDGEWISPVITPTDTMGAISGQLLQAPPMATHITYYKGRIYLASGKYIWATELYLYNKVDFTKNFIQLTADITMLEAVENGIFVGTEDGLYFLGGTMSAGLKQDKLSDAAVVRGSEVTMPASKIYPQARDSVPAEGHAVVFLTDDGICAGFDNGQMFNLTYTKLHMPKAQSAAALYREQDGVNQYVVSADSGGTPTSTARIGDFVDAEIRRFQGG